MFRISLQVVYVLQVNIRITEKYFFFVLTKFKNGLSGCDFEKIFFIILSSCTFKNLKFAIGIRISIIMTDWQHC